jgi:hypothetical protein
MHSERLRCVTWLHVLELAKAVVVRHIAAGHWLVHA